MPKNSLQNRPQRSSVVVKPKSVRNRKPKGSKRSFRRRLQYWYWRLVRMQGQPEMMARGLACGVFAGLFPIFGLQIIIGVCLAVLLRGNKILAAAGTWISNPLTSIPIYAFNYHIGKWLLHQQDDLTDVSLQSWEQVKELGSGIIFTLLVGCFAVGLVCAIVSYFLGLWLIRRARTSQQVRSRRKRSHKHYPEDM